MINLTGKRFERLLVLKQAGKKYNRPSWLCVCDCGNSKIIAGANLRNGNTMSCGCLNKQNVSEALKNKHRSEEVKLKISKTLTGRKRPTFSKVWRSNLSKALVGNKNNYNSNRKEEDRINRRHIYGYSTWYKSIFERDHYTCQYCNVRGVKLCAHHIESYHDNIELRIELDNGITLCKECHKSFHSIYGYKCNRKQFEAFLTKRGLNI